MERDGEKQDREKERGEHKRVVEKGNGKVRGREGKKVIKESQTLHVHHIITDHYTITVKFFIHVCSHAFSKKNATILLKTLPGDGSSPVFLCMNLLDYLT